MSRIGKQLQGFYQLTRPSLEEGHAKDFVREPLYIGATNEKTWLLSRNVGPFKGFCFHQRRVSTCILHRTSAYEGTSMITMMIAFGENLEKKMFPGIMMATSPSTKTPHATIFVLSKAVLSIEEKERLSKLSEMKDQSLIMGVSRRMSEVLPSTDNLPKKLIEKGFDLISELPSEGRWYEVLEETSS